MSDAPLSPVRMSPDGLVIDFPDSPPVPVVGVPVGFRTAQKRDQDWHEPLEASVVAGLDGHYPDWGPWEQTDKLTPTGPMWERRCLSYRCGLTQGRDRTPTDQLDAAPEFMTADKSIVATVTVAGRGIDVLAPPPPCEHRTFNQQVTVARLVDEDGARVGTKAHLKVRCSECGAPARFVLRTAAVEGDRRMLTCLVDFESDDSLGWVDAESADATARVYSEPSRELRS